MTSIDGKNKGKEKYILVRAAGHLLRIILIVLFLFAIIKNEWLWAFFAAVMIFITFIPIFLRLYFRINFPYLFDVFICLAFIFHMDYGLFNIFGFIPFYNKFTHFFSAVVVAFIFLILLFILNEYYRGVAVNNLKILFDVIVITMAFGVVWEFMEWTSDFLFGWKTQPGLNDTMGDLFADTLGGLFIALIGYILIKRGVLKRFSRNLRKQFDALIDDN